MARKPGLPPSKPKPKKSLTAPGTMLGTAMRGGQRVVGAVRIAVAQAAALPRSSKPAGQFDIGPVNVKQPGYLKDTLLWQKAKKGKKQ